jgi:DNA-directed RNA polymerase specialized sigma24 family protein
MTTFTVTRDETGHWIGRGPDGIHSFARRIDLLPARLCEAVAVAYDIEPPSPDEIILVIDYERLGLPVQVIDSVKSAVALRNELARTEASLAESTRRSVLALTRQGFTVRDIGGLLGITHQRVHQLQSA